MYASEQVSSISYEDSLVPPNHFQIFQLSWSSRHCVLNRIRHGECRGQKNLQLKEWLRFKLITALFEFLAKYKLCCAKLLL